MSEPSDTSKINVQLVNAIVTAIGEQKAHPVDQQSETDSNQVITDFSPELVRTLSQTDETIQKVTKALKGTKKARVAMGSYWRSLWGDLHVTKDGCLFLDHRIVLPSA